MVLILNCYPQKLSNETYTILSTGRRPCEAEVGVSFAERGRPGRPPDEGGVHGDARADAGAQPHLHGAQRDVGSLQPDSRKAAAAVGAGGAFAASVGADGLLTRRGSAR